MDTERVKLGLKIVGTLVTLGTIIWSAGRLARTVEDLDETVQELVEDRKEARKERARALHIACQAGGVPAHLCFPAGETP